MQLPPHKKVVWSGANSGLQMHEVETEEAVLGSLMIDPFSIPRIAAVLSPEDFYIIKNGWIYSAMIKLQDKADLLTISKSLEDSGLLEDTGGDAYLAQLTASVPTALNVDAYAQRVKDFSVRRGLISAASQMAQLGFDVNTPAEDAVAQAATMLGKVSGKAARVQSATKSFAKSYDDYVNWRDTVKNTPLIKTGVKELDDLLLEGGLPRGDNVVFGGAPGTGKTALAIQMCYQVVKAGGRALYFSYEIKWQHLLSRMISMRLWEQGTEIAFSGAAKGTLSQQHSDQWDDAHQELAVLFRDRFLVEDMDTLTLSAFRAMVLEHCADAPLDIIVVDQGWHMLDDERNVDERTRAIHVTGLMRRIPKIVEQATGQMPPLVLNLWPITKEGYDAPEKKHLMESGAVAGNADDVVLFGFDGADKYADKIVIRVDKARLGKLGAYVSSYHRAYNWMGRDKPRVMGMRPPKSQP